MSTRFGRLGHLTALTALYSTAFVILCLQVLQPTLQMKLRSSFGSRIGLNMPQYLTTGRNQKDEFKMQAIRKMMVHAWTGYENSSWGHDDLQPISRTYYDWYQSNNLLNTPVDALDTLHTMGLNEEYVRAKELVLAELDFQSIDVPVSVFETTIRILGGLLSAYELDGDERLKEKAVQLAELLLPAFNTTHGLPENMLILKSGKTIKTGQVSLAEIGSLQLEFQYLSDITGNPVYSDVALNVYTQLARVETPVPGLLPEKLLSDYLTPSSTKVSLGGMSDSYYEYLLKMWLSTGDNRFFNMYYEAADSFAKFMVRYSDTGGLYIPAAHIISIPQAVKTTNRLLPVLSDGERDKKLINIRPYVQSETTFEHLACFSGGMFATGALSSRSKEWTLHLDIGRKLTDFCWNSYAQSATGIGPESIHGRSLQALNPRYHLRPEAIESLFYMWRLTHDPIYRERAWKIALALDKYCRVETGGYRGLSNVNNIADPGMDRQESFFLAETLKIFSDDDTIPLEKFVFNTEAHPVSVRGHGRRSKIANLPQIKF